VAVKKRKIVIPVLVLLLSLICGCRKKEGPAQQEGAQENAKPQVLAMHVEPKWQRKGDFVTTFAGLGMGPGRRDLHINYAVDPNIEQFFVHVPDDYTGEAAYGLVVFIDAASESRQLPDGWQTVLDGRRFLYIAPQNAGNDQYSATRMGLAVLAALEMMKHYQVDPSRFMWPDSQAEQEWRACLGSTRRTSFTAPFRTAAPISIGQSRCRRPPHWWTQPETPTGFWKPPRMKSRTLTRCALP
jgi:hypothetical protein